MTLNKMIAYKEQLIRLLFLVICFNMIALYKVYGADHNPIYYEYEEEHIYSPVTNNDAIYETVTNDNTPVYIKPNTIKNPPALPLKTAAIIAKGNQLAQQQSNYDGEYIAPNTLTPPRPPKSHKVQAQQAQIARQQKQDELYDTIVPLTELTAKLNEIISRYPLLRNELPQTMGVLTATMNNIIDLFNDEAHFNNIRKADISEEDLLTLKEALKFVLCPEANELIDSLIMKKRKRHQSIFSKSKNGFLKK